MKKCIQISNYYNILNFVEAFLKPLQVDFNELNICSEKKENPVADCCVLHMSISMNTLIAIFRPFLFFLIFVWFSLNYVEISSKSFQVGDSNLYPALWWFSWEIMSWPLMYIIIKWMTVTHVCHTFILSTHIWMGMLCSIIH